eukprot:4252853-Pyramimonas_sp.AAC.1
MRDVAASWWARIHTLVQRIERHRRRRNGTIQVQQLAADARRLALDVPAGVQSLFPAGGGVWTDWLAAMRQLEFMEPPALTAAVALADRGARRG